MDIIILIYGCTISLISRICGCGCIAPVPVVTDLGIGPPAILTKDGIVLLYNGKNEPGEKGDTAYPANSYCAGQALFDVNNPTKLIGRLDKPFLQPTDDFEKSGQYPAGTVFVEGLVYYRNKWYLYYGCADSFVAVAVSDKQLNF